MFCFTDFCQWTYFSNVFTNSTCLALRISANGRMSITYLRILRVLLYGFLPINVFLQHTDSMLQAKHHRNRTVPYSIYINIYRRQSPVQYRRQLPPQHPTPITKKYNRKFKPVMISGDYQSLLASSGQWHGCQDPDPHRF